MAIPKEEVLSSIWRPGSFGNKSIPRGQVTASEICLLIIHTFE